MSQIVRDNMKTQSESALAGIRELATSGRYDDAWQLVRAELLNGAESYAWSAARNLLRAGAAAGWAPRTTREIRLGLLCSYEGSELAEHIRLACLALGVDAELYLAPFGQLEQELLGTDTGLSEFQPTHVLIAPTTADLGFPELATDGAELLDAAERRWRSLWDAVRTNHRARVVQHGFVVPDETALGHLSMRTGGSQISLVRQLNLRIADEAGSDVLLVDCERLAARIGKRRWIDPRLWYSARQPFGHEALTVLARETAAVLAGDLGLGARCLIVDLDNTLWGGVVGEEGPEGVVVGLGPEGEAFAAFQEYVGALRQRGVILAVASKNDLEVARQPFAQNAGMRLQLDDFAVFVADWRRKPEQIAEIAETLGLGLDSIVFADDNPAECAEVAAALPEVTVVALDVVASERVRMLAASARFEISNLSREDGHRALSYAARAKATELLGSAASLEDFWRSLRMRARVTGLGSVSVDRVAQLTQKTNQFNLTLHRRNREEIERLADDADAICLALELEDRFASHGVVGLGFVAPSPEDPSTAVIDTLLMSCRVIGRTAEVHLLSHLSRAASAKGFSRLRGFYVPGPRNALVSDLYSKLGFTSVSGGWEYDLVGRPTIHSPYIEDAT